MWLAWRRPHRAALCPLQRADTVCACPPPLPPPQELRWLVTNAWNRGALHARFGRGEEAARYQRWAADALRYNASLAEQYGEFMAAEMGKMRAAQEGHLCALDPREVLVA